MSKTKSAPAKRGTKKAKVLSMLKSKQGATIDDIVKATDWQPHTARGFISGLRKSGMFVENKRPDGNKGAGKYHLPS